MLFPYVSLAISYLLTTPQDCVWPVRGIRNMATQVGNLRVVERFVRSEDRIVHRVDIFHVVLCYHYQRQVCISFIHAWERNHVAGFLIQFWCGEPLKLPEGRQY